MSTASLTSEIKRNKRVWEETLHDSIQYKPGKAELIEKTEEKLESREKVKQKQTILVLNEPILSVAKIASEKHLNPLVVNCGNTNDPIKIVESGAIGQESDLLRRSNLGLSISPDDHYPLRNKSLYCPDITIHKNASYVMTKSFKINVLTLAAVSFPALINISADGKTLEDYKSPSDRQAMQLCIDHIFKVAVAKGHKCVVVGDFGVAMGNPARIVIDMFNSAFERYPVRYCFFAITDTSLFQKKASNTNFLLFSKHIKRTRDSL
jgi:uncharacterized protein (TIGR02452 family)